MSDYTTMLQSLFDEISPEDEDFIEKLIDVSRRFRTFSEGLSAFIAEHGYDGDPTDDESKAAFIRDAFVRAGMTPPRELKKWFVENQSVKRETAFQICFAFHLDGLGTDAFFQRVFARERSLDCHVPREAVYYYCLNNGLSYAEAERICRGLPEPPEDRREGQPIVYTASIILDLCRIDSPEGLKAYLTENIRRFGCNNVKARESIRRMWREIAGPDGMVAREFQRFYPNSDDIATREVRGAMHRAKNNPDASASNYEIYLAIFQLDKRRVGMLNTDRNLKPVLRLLHSEARDSFPDRQGIERILRDQPVSYERIRKWLILLRFYTFWVAKRLETGSCQADKNDDKRCVEAINRVMDDAGYAGLYLGNPYDWLFLYVAKDQEPLVTFRNIWASLLERAIQDAPENAGTRREKR